MAGGVVKPTVRTVTHDGREVKKPNLKPPVIEYEPVNMKNKGVFWNGLIKIM